MDYEDEERDKLPLIIMVIIVLALGGGVLWWLTKGAAIVPLEPVTHSVESSSIEEPDTPTAQPKVTTLSELPEETSVEVLENLGVKVQAARPGEVAATIAKIRSKSVV